MTLPKSGSRSVLVDNRPHRFKVTRGEDTSLRVIIEDEEHPGHFILALFDHRRCPGVGPADVVAFVRYARQAGWRPQLMGNFAMGDHAVDEALNTIGR